MQIHCGGYEIAKSRIGFPKSFLGQIAVWFGGGGDFL